MPDCSAPVIWYALEGRVEEWYAALPLMVLLWNVPVTASKSPPIVTPTHGASAEEFTAVIELLAIVNAVDARCIWV